MRFYIFALSCITIVSSTMTTAHAAEDLTPLINGEYAKTQGDIQAKVTEARKKVAALREESKRVVEKILAKNKSEANATEIMRKYNVLLTSRYIDNAGKFQSGLEISPTDLANINKVFQNYLDTTPLNGKVSAGQAQRTLEWGMDRLKGLQKLSGDPSPKNHPELEIIAWQIQENEESIKRSGEIAKRIGFEVTAEGAGDRAPASAAATENK